MRSGQDIITRLVGFFVFVVFFAAVFVFFVFVAFFAAVLFVVVVCLSRCSCVRACEWSLADNVCRGETMSVTMFLQWLRVRVS